MASLAAAKEMAEFYLETAAPGMVIHDQTEHVDGWEFMVNWPGDPTSIDGFYAFVNTLGIVRTQPQPYSTPRGDVVLTASAMEQFYSPSQRRDARGRWAKGGGVSSPLDSLEEPYTHLSDALSIYESYGIGNDFYRDQAEGIEKVVEERINSIDIDPNTGEAVAHNLRASLNDAQLKIGVPPQRVLDLLVDGQFRNGYEVGTDMGAGGPDYDKFRMWVEDTLIGVPSTTSHENRPIYGYFEGPSTQGMFTDPTRDTFPVNFIVKPEIRERTTVTFGDSLNNLGTAIKVPDLKNATTEDIIRSTGLGRAEYAEAQIHGGLTLDDISHVEINIGRLEDQLYQYESEYERIRFSKEPLSTHLRIVASSQIEDIQIRLRELESVETDLEENGIDVRRI